MGTERKPIATAEDWMRNVERRATQQERRRQIHSASDLLGPGFGPTAKQILDWNSEEATFTGFFWSPVGGLNSPDSSSEWIGYTISEDDRRYGVQHASSVRENDPPLEFTRRFENPTAGLTAIYTPWRGQTDWQTAGCTATGPCTITSQSWRKTGSVVSLSVNFVLTSDFTWTSDKGDVANTEMLQVAPDIVPNGPLLNQGLTSGASGPMQHYVVSPTGAIILTAIEPAGWTTPKTAPATTQLSVSGTYML